MLGSDKTGHGERDEPMSFDHNHDYDSDEEGRMWDAQIDSFSFSNYEDEIIKDVQVPIAQHLDYTYIMCFPSFSTTFLASCNKLHASRIWFRTVSRKVDQFSWRVLLPPKYAR